MVNVAKIESRYMTYFFYLFDWNILENNEITNVLSFDTNFSLGSDISLI